MILEWGGKSWIEDAPLCWVMNIQKASVLHSYAIQSHTRSAVSRFFGIFPRTFPILLPNADSFPSPGPLALPLHRLSNGSCIPQSQNHSLSTEGDAIHTASTATERLHACVTATVDAAWRDWMTSQYDRGVNALGKMGNIRKKPARYCSRLPSVDSLSRAIGSTEPL